MNELDSERLWVGARVLAAVLAAATGLVALLGFFGIATVDDLPDMPPQAAIVLLAALAAVSLAANVWLLRSGGKPRTRDESGDEDQFSELDQITTWMRQAMTFLEQIWSMRAPVRADAEEVAAQAEQYAYRLEDETARELVLTWKRIWDYIPKDASGWVSAEAVDLRNAHREAQARIGELIAKRRTKAQQRPK